jgi:diacylglycerol kinase (ATP)
MLMAPDASIDDGQLDVIAARSLGRMKLLSLLPRIFSGRHVEDPLIEVYRGKEITLTSDTPMKLTPDGEIMGTTPVHAECLPGRVRMFCR